MIRILSSAQTRDLDAYTIANEPVASIDLMERACRAFVSWFITKVDIRCRIGVVCGTGNNGGDGLGISRMLAQHGFNVKLWVVRGGVAESHDFKLNYARLQETSLTAEDITSSPPDLFAGCDVLIDALFGSGLSRPAEGLYAVVIDAINNTACKRIAVDIPSGLRADAAPNGPTVKAHATVSFQLPKLTFFLPKSQPFVGEWTTVDIGLNKTYIKTLPTGHFFVNRKSIRKLLRKRSPFDHKGDYGHALLVAGSEGKIGASILSARAALRAGLGLLTVHTPRVGYTILQTAVPEAMITIDGSNTHFAEAPDTVTYTAIGAGPGLGKHSDTVRALSTLMKAYQKPMVLDADALNIIAGHRELLHVIPRGSILTPHPKEFERLVGEWKDDFDRLAKQKELAAQLGCVVLVKGAFTTIVSADGKTYFNATGNPGMATGGTGDVLTGMLTGLLAQRYSPLDAALLGAYLHGLAGDLAAEMKGMNGMIASDVIDFIPEAFIRLS